MYLQAAYCRIVTHAVLVVTGAELRGPLVPEGALGTGEVVGHAVGALAEGSAVGGVLHVNGVLCIHRESRV